jgi:hypothetical protein
LIVEYRKIFPLVNVQLVRHDRHEGSEMEVRPRASQLGLRPKPYFIRLCDNTWHFQFVPSVPQKTCRLCFRYWSKIWPDAINTTLQGNKVLLWKGYWYGKLCLLGFDGNEYRLTIPTKTPQDLYEVESYVKEAFHYSARHLSATLWPMAISKSNHQISYPKVRVLKKRIKLVQKSFEDKLPLLLDRISPMRTALNAQELLDHVPLNKEFKSMGERTRHIENYPNSFRPTNVDSLSLVRLLGL